MMGQTEIYQLSMLAQAEDADGNPVHPGLRQRCLCVDERGDRQSNNTCGECTNNIHVAIGNAHQTGRPATIHNVHTSNCERCGPAMVYPNPDPMVLIAACHAQRLWSVHFWDVDDVTIGLGNNSFRWRSTNLIDAVFKATVQLAANWGDCQGCHDGDSFRGAEGNEECPDCHGTGKVIKGDQKP